MTIIILMNVFQSAVTLKNVAALKTTRLSQEHNELVEYHKQRNDIINIDINPNSEDYREFLKIWNNL